MWQSADGDPSSRRRRPRRPARVLGGLHRPLAQPHVERFVGVMQEILDVLSTTYGAETVAVVPGGGTYGMEAVARQLATGQRCLVVRNGLFSYRWSQILDAGPSPARDRLHGAAGRRRAPGALDPGAGRRGRRRHRARRPEVVFAPHVETAAGHAAARRLRARGRRRDARGRRPLRPRLHRVRRAVGRHGRPRRRRADQRAAEGLERLTVRGLRDARRGRARAASWRRPRPASPSTCRSG